MDDPATPTPTTPALRRGKLAKRAGVWVFLFFLVKGLAWLVIPGSAAVAAWLAD